MTTDKMAVTSLAQGLVDAGYDQLKKRYDVQAIRRSLTEGFGNNLLALEITSDGTNVQAHIHHDAAGYIVIDSAPRNHHSRALV